MSMALMNKFSFPAELVKKAVAFSSGVYVEVDDLAFEANGLGRKIVQTQCVEIDGKDVSVGYVSGEDAAPYELILAEENPVELGTLDELIRKNGDLFLALQSTFGGVSGYGHMEMVLAIRKATQDGVLPLSDLRIREIVLWARKQAKRAAWVASNHMRAVIEAPIKWDAIGL